uniref:FMRFamide-related neuropeptides n=1 Tax=Macrostomum lignano TaxID=282301 RepID=A0A1I8JRL5_9PLAT
RQRLLTVSSRGQRTFSDSSFEITKATMNFLWGLLAAVLIAFFSAPSLAQEDTDSDVVQTRLLRDFDTLDKRGYARFGRRLPRFGKRGYTRFGKRGYTRFGKRGYVRSGSAATSDSGSARLRQIREARLHQIREARLRQIRKRATPDSGSAATPDSEARYARFGKRSGYTRFGKRGYARFGKRSAIVQEEPS